MRCALIAARASSSVQSLTGYGANSSLALHASTGRVEADMAIRTSAVKVSLTLGSSFV